MIREAYDKYFSTRNDTRAEFEAAEGHKMLHVSDLGDCSRATWARRNGKQMIPTNADTKRKFDMGFDIEARVGSVLDTLEGYRVERNHVHRIGGAIGHSDFLVIHEKDLGKSFVVEVKSTTFYPKQVAGKRIRVEPKPSEVQWHYRIQAAAYAWDMHLPRFCIVVVCRESGMMAECWYKTEDYHDALRDLLAEKERATGISAPIPAAEPPPESFNWKGESWRCKYCRYAGCEKNENPEALSLLEVA